MCCFGKMEGPLPVCSAAADLNQQRAAAPPLLLLFQQLSALFLLNAFPRAAERPVLSAAAADVEVETSSGPAAQSVPGTARG